MNTAVEGEETQVEDVAVEEPPEEEQQPALASAVVGQWHLR